MRRKERAQRAVHTLGDSPEDLVRRVDSEVSLGAKARESARRRAERVYRLTWCAAITGTVSMIFTGWLLVLAMTDDEPAQQPAPPPSVVEQPAPPSLLPAPAQGPALPR